MHSSIINKIRILKPRKKVAAQQNAKKSFTISNDNCHSSILLHNKPSDVLPPLEPPKSSESEVQAKDGKWVVPFYVVNMPKVGVGMVGSNIELGTGSNAELDTTNLTPAESNFQPIVSSSAVLLNIANQNTGIQNNEATISDPSSMKTSTSESAKTDHSTCSQRVSRPRLVKVNNSVNCFLCPTKFHSVQEMQDHYLESHKHKKRPNPNVKSVPKKVGRPSTRPKDPLTLADGDCTSGDGEPKCPICSIYFKTKDEVKSHMTSVHCYKCSECPNTFYTLYQFTDHRCSKYIKQKKPKLKKKKIKTASPRVQELEKDPLAIPVPVTKYVRIQQKELQMQPEVTYSMQQPSQNSASSTSVEIYSSKATSCINTTATISNNTTTSTATSCNRASVTSSVIPSSAPIIAEQKSSLMNYTLEELTSKEFNKMKLDEIIKNPNLSINWVPKKKAQSDFDSQEFFTCGRCNVLCEDKADYVEHLEECLRLSNVSLLSTKSPPQRILKLNSEIIPNSVDKFTKTSINKKLLKELKGYIEAEADIFKVEEDEVPSQPMSMSQDEMTLPNLKGGVSITRLNPLYPNPNVPQNTAARTKEHKTDLPVVNISETSQSHKYPSVNTPLGVQHPMVIIPLDNHPQAKPGIEKTNDEPDYPNISITDKSNSVTWNFIGSEAEPVLRVESPRKSKETTFSSAREILTGNSLSKSGAHKTVSADVSTRHEKGLVSSSGYPDGQENETVKTEPLSLTRFEDFEEDCKDSPSSEDCKESCASMAMELVLDEDEIKMEVEDEVVDDRF